MAQADMALTPDGFLGRALAAFGGRRAGARAPKQAVGALRAVGPDVPPPTAPEGADWAWRPAGFVTRMSLPGHAGVTSGTQIGDGMTLFHDCPAGEIVVRQHAQAPSSKTAPQGFSVETFHFSGSYLSFALALPVEAVRSLTPGHVVTVETRMTTSPPVETYLRLNLRHGPNVTRIIRQAPWAADEVRVDFDFASVTFQPNRLTEVWLDVILDRPEMTRCLIEDVVISRRLRAAL